MRLLRGNPSRLLTPLVGLSIFAVSAVASASPIPGPCHVPLESDPTNATVKLENCVADVNAGVAEEIVFEGPQSYLLTQPLEIHRDVVIHGAGQVLYVKSNFGGSSMIVVGAPCSGPTCGAPIEVAIEGLELHSLGSPDTRGIDLLPENTLTLDETYLHDLETTGSGGCVRAQSKSELTVTGGLLENCFAAGDGGAISTEASVTLVDGAEIRDSEALLGGGIHVSAAGAFKRKLRMWGATLQGNMADQGGAVYTEIGDVSTSLNDCLVQGNDAVDGGGGLYGGAEIRRSVFEGNTAGTHGGGALLETESRVSGSTFRANDAWRGGGISVRAVGNFDMDIASSTFVANTVSAVSSGVSWGAGILVGRAVNPPPNSTTYIRNCTFSENVATAVNGIGGGLGVSGMPVIAEHLTFFDNEASNGRAIYSSTANSSDLTLRSSIMANSVTDPTNPVCFLGPTYQTTTSLDTDGSCGVAQPNVDPLLDPLTDNGGDTQTHLPNAPEVQASAACFEPYDQRGAVRPSTGCDIGSVEK